VPVIPIPREVGPGATVAHVGVAVASLSEALPFYRDLLGLPVEPPETADGATIVAVTLGATRIELLEAADPDGPIARFVARRGPGIHHICLRVPDLDAALERCRAAGYRLIDETPRPGAHGRRIAFIHPGATAGILLELTD
jgi:methylmalonyl-CoA/ethylmalonyl-CoA epimerase